jgi:hypothetical protein
MKILSDEDIDSLKLDYEWNGISVEDLVSKYGVSRSTVYRYLNEPPIGTHGKLLTPREIEKMLVSKNCNIRDLERFYRSDRNGVHRLIEKHGIDVINKYLKNKKLIEER